MKRTLLIFALAALSAASCAPKYSVISKTDLQDKIKGGWAAQTIGVTFGQPTEFRYLGTTIPDSISIDWQDDQVIKYFNNDDIYMDLTFVGVLDRLGIDAPADSFAVSFANAGYNLWHANQSARYNILQGIMPPESGHWKNNPHANDIDFQIEADFAGLMSPGMPNGASEIADRVGHLMNYGGGWYGGVFIGGMYSEAFFSSDIDEIVANALKLIPEETHFHQCMADVIAWHNQNPDDWKATWQLVQDKWSEETGCPEGQFGIFNIDAIINSAYVLIGLLYGEGDFEKTIEISTRCGQDSDCNPASAAGILGTIMGYDAIPEKYLEKLHLIEGTRLDYTPYSLNDVYEVGFRHALDMVEKYGGKVDGENVVVKRQKPAPVRLEISFEGIKACGRTGIGRNYDNFESFEFDGCGIVLRGDLSKAQSDYDAQLEVFVDGVLMKTVTLPGSYHSRSNDLYWNFNLENGHHVLNLSWLNRPADDSNILIHDAVLYAPEN